MTPYEWGEIVLVPFPFTDLTSTKKRPALIVSPGAYNRQGDLVLAFITSNLQGPQRYGDLLLADWKMSGLPLPSKLRMKFTTISVDIVVKRLGRIQSNDASSVRHLMRDFFEIESR